jgi:hypothetical protein
MFKGYLEEERGSLFDGYYEKHRNSDLLSCRSADGVQVVFCPSDQSGVWAGLIVKGSLGRTDPTNARRYRQRRQRPDLNEL